MICHITKDTLIINNWVMSCRVLNRTLENFILNTISKFCLKKKIKYIKSKFIQTEKNTLVKNLFDDLGFKVNKINKNKKEYIYCLNDHNHKKTHIKEL